MAPSSGTYSFVDTEQIDFVTEAYERIGRTPDTLSSNDIDSARRSTNFMLADWANEGPQLWKTQLFSQALTVGQSTVTLTKQQCYVMQVYTRMSTGDGPDQDLILSAISRAEYAALPYKSQTGQRPFQYYLQRTITPTLYLWPLPDNDDITLYWYSMVTIEDAGAFTNSFDIPNRWMEALAAGLAARLAVKFAPDRADDLTLRAGVAYQRACAEDRERVPLRITPDMSGYSI